MSGGEDIFGRNAWIVQRNSDPRLLLFKSSRNLSKVLFPMMLDDDVSDRRLLANEIVNSYSRMGPTLKVKISASLPRTTNRLKSDRVRALQWT